MPVYRGSRYEGVRFTGVLGSDGKIRKFLHARTPLTPNDASEPIIVHVVQRGEELDGISHRSVGESRLWWMIADVSNVLFPLGISPNTEVGIPLSDMRRRVQGA